MLGAVSTEQAAEALRSHAPSPNGPDAYRVAFSEASPAELFGVVQSDAAFRMPAIHLADAQVSGRGRVFVYELTWSAPARGGAFGAYHALDYGLVFGIRSAGLSALLAGDGPGDEFETMSAEVRRRWVAFAESGDPGWAPYDSRRRLVQLIDPNWDVVSYPEERSRLIWADERPEALPLLAVPA